MDAPADVVVDLGDGAAWRAARGRRLWGAALGSAIVLGDEPIVVPGDAPEPAARALLEVLAAGEALWILMGHAPHAAYNTLL